MNTLNRTAPVLVATELFEPQLCRSLIEHYERNGGLESGVMRQIDGKTVGVYDHAAKRRKDCVVEDVALKTACRLRIHERLRPQILAAFQYEATRMERNIVACYDAADGGHFRAHRDNTTAATAHRRFAVSLFLNTGEFDGGELRFPEFGDMRYSAPTGVRWCSRARCCTRRCPLPVAAATCSCRSFTTKLPRRNAASRRT